MPVSRTNCPRSSFPFALFFAVLMVALLQPQCALAQSASVSGRVTDNSNAVIPDVEVEIRNTDTGVTQNTKTNRDGFYTFAVLNPGHYLMNVRKQQFQTVSVTGIILNVQDNLSRNFVLQVGSSAESITVTAAGYTINTTDATVSTVVDRQFAENLPLNGRSFQTLIYLTPGVVVTTSNIDDNGQFSVNGQRPVSNYWMVDGVSANIGIGATGSSPSPGNGLGGALGSFSVLGGTNSLVSVDALQEFRIQTSTYAPEFGRTPGGQISIVTRSGTNQFHGTLFDYFRNDVLDANNWFNTAVTPPLPKAEERQNDFGGTFTGPIVKDRTFFFFSYEGLRLRLPQTSLDTVPDANPADPLARQNAIAAVQPFLNAFPLPNGPQAKDALGNPIPGVFDFNASYSNPASLDAYSLRIDHKLSDKWSLFGRYNYSPSEILQHKGGGGPISELQSENITIQTATAGATWVISPTISNDLRFNYSRTNAESHFSMDNSGGAVPLTSAPFPSPFTVQNANFQLFLVALNDGFIELGNGQHQLQKQINIVDSLSAQRGSHSMKFGVDFRRLTPLFDPPAYSLIVEFADVPSTVTGNYALTAPSSTIGATFLFRNLGLYAQDTWRAAPRLTLTYGLRWDLDFVPKSINGPNFAAATGFDLNNLSNLALAPVGTPLYKTTYGNVAPRVGAAYQLSQSQDWQTVVRGGFGVFYDLATSEEGSLLLSGGQNYPFGSFTSNPPGTFPLSASAVAPLPIAPPNATNGGALLAFDPRLRLPYTLEWNVAFEQAIGRQQTISASYIGAAGRRLLDTAFVFSPNPNLAAAQLVTNKGTSDYHSLQVQFQRRLSRGLQALASYAWSHSIDTGSAGSTAVTSNALVASAINANRGPSDFDIRTAFNAGITYDVPAPKANALMNAFLRGWSIDNIILARSAPPVTVASDIYNGMFVETLNGSFTFLRPDVVPGQPFYLHGAQYPGGKALNPAAFTAPPTDPKTGQFLQGNLGRNALRGFGMTQWDFAVHRDFPIHESLKLQFRAEMFNVLNHPNFGLPDGLLSDPTFGLSTSMLGQALNNGNLGGGAFDPLYQLGGTRSIQFALKLIF
jgi:hypothetical protein